MQKYIMALDQGTTSSRCIVFDKKGSIVSMAQKELEQFYPEPEWVEHNPREIWASQMAVTMEAISALGVTTDDIISLGITNQRETTIVWDKVTGEPIYNAIVWQCRRTAPMIKQLIADGLSDYVHEVTGLVPDAYFSASKIAWILDHVPGSRERARAGELYFGTVDTWLVYNLSKGKLHVTDYTNASRTMLFNIHTLQWDQKLLDYFDIPCELLPEVHPSSYQFGYMDESLLGGHIAITGIAGDQQAALFGQCCFDKGDAKNTYGTGCFLLMNTGKEAIRSEHGLITTILAGESDDVDYALEGSVFVAGSAIQWLRDGMRMIKTVSQSQDYCEAIDDTDGVYVVPAFTGIGAPYWNSSARGTIFGLTRGCKKEQFIRATLESIVYQSADVLRAMEEDAKHPLHYLKVDGGASANDFLMQFQSDMLGSCVYRPRSIETTALGVAYLSGLASGFWKDRDEIRTNWQLGTVFEPNISMDKRNRKLKGWKRAVRSALFWAEDEEK